MPNSLPCALELTCLEPRIVPSTIQDFDGGAGTNYLTTQHQTGPEPVLLAGGPTDSGQFLRLVDATAPTPSHGTADFDLSDPGAHERVFVDFDFRMTPLTTRADGFGVALLNTGIYGKTADGKLGGNAEEVQFAGSLGVGFDIYQNDDLGDLGNDNIRANFGNSISLHFDNKLIQQFDVTEIVDMAGGQWIHAQLEVDATSPTANVSVTIASCSGGTPFKVIDRVPVPGLTAYESRLHFGARAGGETAHHDIDNIRAEFLSGADSMVSLGYTSYLGVENRSHPLIQVVRSGNTSVTQTVQIQPFVVTPAAGTGFGSAMPGDYVNQVVDVAFAAGQTEQLVMIPLGVDTATEPIELFGIQLINPTGGVIGGIDSAGVRIIDDESGRTSGYWQQPICSPILAVHSALLPSGELIYWDRLGNIRIMEPGSGAITIPASPTEHGNIFCVGQSLLPDGRLFLTGGHDHAGGGAEADGVGLKQASIYDPATNMWTSVPDMNAGRWYPTNTTLPNGDVLVLSGSFSKTYEKNLLPQVWQTSQGTWRDLTTAQDSAAHGADLYPRMFVLPDGRLFKAGPDQDTWFLDTSGTGKWTPGPTSTFGFRSYGTAVMYEPGKILIAGGGDLTGSGAMGDLDPTNDATATAEIIDLSPGGSGTWQSTGSMKFARRHAVATMLPDGKVLITGGVDGPGFNNETEPILSAELWDPATGQWTEVAKMRIPRGYHTSAVLLPDGRVIIAGSGQGAGALGTHTEFQIYTPGYLLKGPRPLVTAAPKAVMYGSNFNVGVANPGAISKVSLIRLGSATHAFDMEQRYVPLDFTTTANGLSITAPASGTIAPPGYYHLFVVNADGVPSLSEIIHVSDQPPPTVIITESEGNTTVAEGGFTDSYTIVLSKQPTANVTVTLIPGTQLSLDKTTITFTPANWNQPQTVTVAAVDDTVVEGSHSDSIMHTVRSADLLYDGLLVNPVGVSIVDNEHGVIVTPNELTATEGGPGASYTLVLASQPSANVQVTTMAGNPATGATTTPMMVTFTPDNWDQPQTVMVNAVDDSVLEGRHSDSITHSVSSTDPNYDGRITDSVSVTLVDNERPLAELIGTSEFAVGGGTGSGSARFFNQDTSERDSSFLPSFPGGIRVATGFFNDDNISDLVVGSGPGMAATVQVFDGKTGTELFSVPAPFEPSFLGGVFVAAGDLTGDGIAEVVFSPDEGGGGRVRIFDGNTKVQLADFFGIEDPNFRGGARVAVADINGDGRGDLIVAAGFGGGPRLAVFDGARLGMNGGPKLFGDFFVFEQELRNGVYVAGGDFNGDGKADIVAGGGPGGGPRVQILSGVELLAGGVAEEIQNPLDNFFAGDMNNRNGIRVGVINLDNDSRADLIVGEGESDGSTVTGYHGNALRPLVPRPEKEAPTAAFQFEAFPGFTGGVFVG